MVPHCILKYILTFPLTGWKINKGIFDLSDQGWKNFCSWCYIRKCRLFSTCHAPSIKVKVDLKLMLLTYCLYYY